MLPLLPGHRETMNYREITINLPEIAKDAVTHRLMEIGCLGTVERPGAIIAYFDEPADIARIEKEILSIQSALNEAGLDVPVSVQHTIIPSEDWNRTWKAGFKPLDVGERFTVLPPWEEKKSGRTCLVIDPGMAFGTGHHETTRSCLVLVEKVSARTAKTSFLEVIAAMENAGLAFREKLIDIKWVSIVMVRD